MRVWIGGIWLTALAAAAVAGDAQRAQVPPPAAPSASSDAGSLPGSYQVLLSRSIFAANGRSDTGAAAPGGAAAGAALALKGVVQDDQEFTAFVEDAPAKRVLEVKVGDRLAHGRVVAITLHGLQYELAGRVMRVAIGQGLEDPAAPTTAPAEAPVAQRSPPRHPSSLAEAR